LDVVKELGDGLLLRSDHFENILEVVLIMWGVSLLWSDHAVPEGLRGGLSFRASVTRGEARAVKRAGSGKRADYLGSSVDRVARLSSVPYEDDGTVMLIDEETRRAEEATTIRRYGFVTVGDVRALRRKQQKANEKVVRYYPLTVDQRTFNEHRSHFQTWRV
jgi:hypothetical protein